MVKILCIIICSFFPFFSAFAQAHIIRAQVDTLLSMLPEAPDTLIKDAPMFETPNVHPQRTFELTQIYYDKSLPMRLIEFKMQDYSINPDYYREQALESFNLDKGNTVDRSDTLMGYVAHIYYAPKKTSVTLFLGEYMIAVLKQEGADWTISQLRQFLDKIPVTAIRNRMLEIGKMYRKTKVIDE